MSARRCLVGASVVAILALAASATYRAPSPSRVAPAPRASVARPAVFRGPLTYVQIETSDVATVRALNALVRKINRRLGYPRTSSHLDGSDAGFVTTDATRPIPHPTQPGRWRLPVDEQETYPALVAIRAACVAQGTSDAGDSGFCVRVAALSFTVARTLDATWSASPAGSDGSRDWDAGIGLVPDDDFPAVAP